jgi:hypothetical protein
MGVRCFRGLLFGLLICSAVAGGARADYPTPPTWLIRPSSVALTPNAPTQARAANFVPRASSAAPVMPLNKSPYPYGYFGAQPQKMWWMHHGHQRSYLQWALR